MLHRLGEEYSQRPMKGHRIYISPSGRQLLRRVGVSPPTDVGTPHKLLKKGEVYDIPSRNPVIEPTPAD